MIPCNSINNLNCHLLNTGVGSIHPSKFLPCSEMSTLPATLGALEVAILISSVLYGVVTLQAWLYAEKYATDKRCLRIMVSAFSMFNGHIMIIEYPPYRQVQFGPQPTQLLWNIRSDPLCIGSLRPSTHFSVGIFSTR